MKKLIIFSALIAAILTSCYCEECDMTECELYNTSTLGIENHLSSTVQITIVWNSYEPTELYVSDTMRMSVTGNTTAYIYDSPVGDGYMTFYSPGYTFIPELKTIATEGCKTTKYQINSDANPGIARISVGMTY